MTKRGTTDLSLLVAVDKPSGMTSHDVVNECRRIFGERRIGHTGTLDPLAEGVLPIAIGPATRLDRYLTGHDKTYTVVMRFGAETTTDDSQGEILATAPCSEDLLYGEFADAYIRGLVGEHWQVPPRYSAIKVNGHKAYELARNGAETPLDSRPIIVHRSELLERRFNEEAGCIEWRASMTVSKGTYIRSLVRDIGRELGCYAHVVFLRRDASGSIGLDACHSLESLSALKSLAALDPLESLGMRYAYGDDFASLVENGNTLESRGIKLYDPAPLGSLDSGARCACCTSSALESDEALEDGETIAMLLENRLKGIYRFDGEKQLLRPETIFSIGVVRR